MVEYKYYKSSMDRFKPNKLVSHNDNNKLEIDKREMTSKDTLVHPKFGTTSNLMQL